MKAAFVSMLAIVALAAPVRAQEQAVRIEGVVIDSVSRQPVKKAKVSLMFTGAARGEAQAKGPQTVTTDLSGSFSFQGLSAGEYQLNVTHQNYPQSRMGGVHKTVEVSASDTAASVTVEMIPGAAVSGHIVDEDGDPLNNCILQPHPAKNFNQGIPIMRVPLTRDDGSYRIYGIPPGKYVVTARCTENVFQPRPLSAGPDPPPSAAYPTLFYPAATDLKSAEIVDLAPGAEKSGVDFQMEPVPVTHIHGTLVAGSADWHGRNDLRVELVPLDPHGRRGFGYAGGEINPKDGTFEIRGVFPGSYRLVAFSRNFSAQGPQSDLSNRIGAVMRVDVSDKPVDVSLQLRRAMDISGRVEIEQSGNNNIADQITPGQLNIQLTSDSEFGGPPAPTQVNDDGSFTIKSVLPGEWRIRLLAPFAFVKSAWLGNDDVTGRPLDLTSGSAAPLRIVVSTNTATIKGTAPAGQMVACDSFDESESMGGRRATHVDSNGQFTFQHLVPGKYRITAGEDFASTPAEGGQEVTVGEGETATIEVKPEKQP
jgi:hypothetical protein